MNHKRDAYTYVDVSRRICQNIEEILSPAQVRSRCAKLAGEHSFCSEVIGHGVDGTPIEAYTVGDGEHRVLVYGLPDPGEAVGATGIVALMESLGRDAINKSRWNVTWTFVPVLNPDDQPESGEVLQTVMKADLGRPEVDWCVSDPRPETTAILDLVERLAPAASFPMHDEYHAGCAIPVYLPVSELLDPTVCEHIRRCVSQFGLTMTEESHPSMGPGFFEMSEAPDYANSTFAKMAAHGPVVICEVSQEPGATPRDLAGAQLAVLFAVLDSTLA